VTTPKEEALFINRSIARIKRNASSAIYVVAQDIRSKLAFNTPNKSGRTARSWRVRKHLRHTLNNNVIATASIHNPVGSAVALEFGISKSNHKHSWVVSVKKGTAKNVQEKDGRIWSRHAVGGISRKVITEQYLTHAALYVSDRVLKGLK